MKVVAILILTLVTLRQALRAMLISNTKEQDKLALILFPTVTMWMMFLGVM